MTRGSRLLAAYLERTNEMPADFAQRLGIPKSSVSRYLSGESTPGRSAAWKIHQDSGSLVPVDSWDEAA